MRRPASLPTLVLTFLFVLAFLFMAAACGDDGNDALSSSSTVASIATESTGEGDGESTPTDTGAGDESQSTEATIDDKPTSTTESASETTSTTAPIPGASTTAAPSTTSGEALPSSSGPAPWASAPLELSALPEVYRLEWAEAGQPDTCPFLAFAGLGPEAEAASIRRAEHDREMLVVWDNPDGPGHDRRGDPCPDCGRGVVGLGTWQGYGDVVGPATIAWDDGSFANIATLPSVYGVSARIQPAGADCMYQLWSHIGVEHVEYLIGRLRQVTT